MTSVRLFLLGIVLIMAASPAMADPCPGFDAAINAVEAALPPVPAPVVLTPPQG